MTREEMIGIIKGFLVEEFEVEEEVVVDEANMQEALELDSLDYVDLFASIENHFGIKLQAEDFEIIKTFNDLYQYIESRMATTS